MIRRLAKGLIRRVKTWQERRLRARESHLLQGPERVSLRDDQVMVTLLARDAGWFLRRFLDHHFALGAAHVLVIDNGSADDTLEICKGYDRVTVIRNRLPGKLHESGLRSELSQRVAQGGWILFADSDELVELPLAGTDALSRLTGYCNAHGFTAVLGQMLDRFSDLPQSQLAGMDYDQAISAMRLYSLRDMDCPAYHDPGLAFEWLLRPNLCQDPQVTFRRGGVRREMFGEDPFLSKHSLVRNVAGVVPMVHPHCASGVRVADVTLCLHHYKLAGDWLARDRANVRSGVWAHGEDARRLAAADKAPEGDWRLTPREAREWRGIAELRKEGFLYASPRFLQACEPR